jgi:hypothetical protein
VVVYASRDEEQTQSEMCESVENLKSTTQVPLLDDIRQAETVGEEDEKVDEIPEGKERSVAFGDQVDDALRVNDIANQLMLRDTEKLESPREVTE